MTSMGVLQISFFFLVLVLLVKPLGWYIAQVFEDKPCGLDRLLGPFEKLIYRVAGIAPSSEMNWKEYLLAMLVFNFLGILLLYAILRFQFYLPFNPQHFGNLSPELAINTAISFVTNTNWQNYAGETTLSYFSQMVGLTTQNFLSAATGLALLMAFIRGIVHHETLGLGNFWVDIIRGTLYVLLPLAIIFSLMLSSQGVIQNLKPYQTVTVLQKNSLPPQQVLPMGPVASQVAIKQLGSNGGGFFATNSAHPFENPTPLTDFLEMLAILLIPAALCYAYGLLAKDTRQGWAILIIFLAVLIPLSIITVMAEQAGNPHLTQMGIAAKPESNVYSGGNMEGKETRFGIVSSALWTTATTATSNGSVNAMLDSFTPLGQVTPLLLMQLGEVIFGGIGTGLREIIIYIILSVFIAGLMVGRTPEYLGKKIDPFEMKMTALVILIPSFIILILTAYTILAHWNQNTLNPGTHYFTEVLYTFTSLANNNGTALAGLNTHTHFYNLIGGIAMLIGRFWLAIPTLAIAGSMAHKKIIPSGPGTLSTHSAVFIGLVVTVLLVLTALTFFPALALGPIVEHFTLWNFHGR